MLYQAKATQVLEKHYANVFKTHGANSNGVDWGDRDRHHTRILELLKCLKPDALRREVVLDVGCGYGELLTVLAEKMRIIPEKYVGIDPCQEMIKEARRKYLGYKFYDTALEQYIPTGDVDHILCCGIFTKKMNASDEDMRTLMNLLFEKAQKWQSKTVTFNTMSPLCDIKPNELYFPQTDEILALLRERWGYRIKEFRFTVSYLKNEMLVHIKIL